jgi:phospholipase C
MQLTASTMYAWEDFVAHAVAAVQASAKLWRSTAIFITEDESGGYYDSGYIQPVSEEIRLPRP